MDWIRKKRVSHNFIDHVNVHSRSVIEHTIQNSKKKEQRKHSLKREKDGEDKCNTSCIASLTSKNKASNFSGMSANQAILNANTPKD